ncbi:ribosome rescue protein RqcH [Candidatus Lokiarchaeum ossiferum]|uniref:ribosome rescue protein RqcH n=1 Tax=Candidatus Lokiarchaeum ossiferum TaxID=2951803 RepID=UPI00352D652F
MATNINNLKLIKKSISNIDIFVLSHELNAVLEDGFIQNIYEVPSKEGKILLIKCRSKDGKKNIIIDPKRRINFTEFTYPVPPFPSQFITSLRKYMKGRRIERVYQYKLDRILIFQLKSSEGKPWKFIVEFFGGGNYILVDGDDMTYMAKSYKKMRDRAILAKKPYLYPPSRGVDLWDINDDLFIDHLKESTGELVRIIARSFNVGGAFSEEICKRANIDKKSEVTNLSNDQMRLIYNTTKNMIESLQKSKFSPRLILNKENIPVGFEPIEMQLYSNFDSKKLESFNQVVDEFFSRFDSDEIFDGEVKESQGKLSKNEKILKKQLEKIDESKKIRERSITQGHLIYQYIPQIDTLINTIMTQKREKKRSWKEITNILKMGKEKQIPECLIFDKIFEKEVAVQIKLEENLFKLDLKKSAIDNAQIIYDRAKKAKKKIIGAKKASIDTKKKIERQKEVHEDVEARKAILLKRPKMKWYEKFRWFISSDNFLIVGGRDASSNEAIVKKHMSKNDLFFHTDVRGASVCIIKNDDNLNIPEQTIKETANFASCYSSAWKQGWGNADIFYVHPEQISKSPKSGEYLKKGSFIVNGTKNFLTKPFLEIGIGVKLISANDQNEEEADSTNENSSINEEGEEKQFYPMVLAGPISALKLQTNNFVRIKPSKSGLKTSKLAKKILGKFIFKARPSEKKWVRLTSIDDLIRIIPTGSAEIAQK